MITNVRERAIGNLFEKVLCKKMNSNILNILANGSKKSNNELMNK